MAKDYSVCLVPVSGIKDFFGDVEYKVSLMIVEYEGQSFFCDSAVHCFHGDSKLQSFVSLRQSQ
jgi:hypothetical protein